MKKRRIQYRILKDPFAQIFHWRLQKRANRVGLSTKTELPLASDPHGILRDPQYGYSKNVQTV